MRKASRASVNETGWHLICRGKTCTRFYGNYSPALGVATLTTSVDEKGAMSKIRIKKEGKVSRKNIRSFKKLFRQHVDRLILEHKGPINEIAFTFRITAKRKED
ncbi:MAG TPA: hypothetical protein VIU12_24280 [Chryseolinea sp.]